MQVLFAVSLAATLFTLPQRPQPAHLSTPQGSDAAVQTPATEQEMLRFCLTSVPEETYRVTRVVDGDTIWIEREGQLEKLRLLSVDTEEKSHGGPNESESKPATRFGEQSTGWAQGFFQPRRPDDPPVRVGLLFPGGKEARDPYGRLLCHVVTTDGVDFNLLLVRRGLSPYFNKYGPSLIAHERFAEAQALARKERRGIWDEQTNRNGKQRPYAKLLPWWDARAEAVHDFRALASEDPLRFVHADDPNTLERSLAEFEERVTVFGLVFKVFEEDDGTWSVLMRSGDKQRALRVHVPVEEVAAMRAFDLEGSMEDYRQNYLLVTGRLTQGPRGFRLMDAKASDWRLAGPQPKMP